MKKTIILLAAVLVGLSASAQQFDTVIFYEGFDSVQYSSNGIASVPENWTMYADNNTNYSQYSAFGQGWCCANNVLQSGLTCAFSISYLSRDGVCDRWLITPAITLPEEGAYNLIYTQYASQYNENFVVKLSTNGTEKEDFTETLMIDYPAATAVKSINLENYAGQTVYIAFINNTQANSESGLFMAIDDVTIGRLPENSIAFAAAEAPNFSPMGQDIDVDVYVYNFGSANLNSYDIEYSINGDTPQTISVSGQNIASFNYGSYTFSINHATAEPINIAITVKNPNGAADFDTSDNSGSVSISVYDPATVTERTSVLEHFTTAVCSNCPGGHERLEQAVNGREDRVVWVAHHSGFYTDGMTINESVVAEKYFNDGGSTYAPACMIDRNPAYATSEDPGPVFFPNSNIRSVMTNALSNPAFVTCQVSDLNYNEQTRELSVTVSGQFTGSIAFDSPRVHLFLMEDSLIGSQAGAQGAYRHDHVLRACISGLDGVEEGFTTTNAGDTYSKTFTYTLPANMRANKCWLGAFVSNHSSNVNKCEIMNGAKTSYLIDHADPTTTGITAVQASINVKTYPNPATEMAFVSAESTIRSYEIVNAMGQIVMAAENVNADVLEINVSNMAQGVYYISITTDNGVASQRLNVVK